MTAQLAPTPVFKAFDNNGLPLAFGILTTYQAGTLLKQATYVDSTQTTQNTNPIILNFRGECELWLDPTLTYKFALTDQFGNTIPGWPVDGIQGGFTPSAIAASLIPTPTDTWNLGSPTNSWAQLYLGANAAPVYDSVTGNIGYYARTAAEIAAGVTPVNYSYAPGDIRRYGTNTAPGTTDMTSAFQAAASCNAVVVLKADTYLVANVTLTQSVLFQGQGFATVILDKATALTHGTYSQNIFTATASIDSIVFRDLTLDGACAGPSNALDSSEIAMVKITNTSNVTFERVKLTRYCGAFGGTVKAISASFWEAIVVQNAARTIFRDCLFTNNHYEMVLIWNAPGSNNEVLIDGCSEINTGTPDSHTSFDLNGGHNTVVNCLWSNTGPDSQLNCQVAQSIRVANCTFLSMQPGTAAQCNIGQDTFPFNSDVLIENNYFLNANSAAISVGSGSSIIIRGNVIDTPVNYGIKLTSGVTSFGNYSIEYPTSEGWPAAVSSGSNSIVIENNVINAVSNSGSLSSGIFLHTVTANSGYWFKDVLISGNTVTAGAAPNNTFWGLRLDDLQDLVIRDNWLQYTQNGINFETLVQNARIEGNTFNGVPPSTNNDILWNGAFTSSNVKIRNNQFNQYPVGQNGTVNVFAGSVSGLDIIDNVGIHPTLPVQGPANTAYVAWQTKGGIRTTTAAPSSGDYALNDVVKNVPTAAQPGEYLCITPGSFGSALTCTANGTLGNNFFTCSAVAQLHVGQHFTVAGAGVAAANLTCTCVYITGSTFYVDQVISTSVSGAAMTLVNPAFVKSANYT